MLSFVERIIRNSPILYRLIYKFSCIFCPKEQTNINLNLIDKSQKRVLISYVSLWRKDFSERNHAQIFHVNQIIHYFISKGYCIDICRLDDMLAYEHLKNNHYDIVLGFGSVYKKFIHNQNIPLKICFITENNPEIVQIKYKERLMYFKERHPHINPSKSTPRVGYFDIEQFKISDYGILMSSTYNANSFIPYIKQLSLINSNANYNENYIFDENEIKASLTNSRKNFLWFGSLGVIHKGLDILIDAFKDLPDLKLNCFGIDSRDKKIYNAIPKSKNIKDCGSINVLSQEFHKDVVLKHCFVLLPSCSEGMSTAIATCMAHGIIPIITKECGFEPTPCIIELDGFHIENIHKTINSVMKMSDNEILIKRRQCYDYARSNFSLRNFDTQFANIMNTILKS